METSHDSFTADKNGGYTPLAHSIKKNNSLAIEKKSFIHQQLLLPSKLITHHPKAGINPLVDAAGYLFSVMGKLKGLKSYPNLNSLQKELIEEMNHFQELAKNQRYGADFILVARYALCVTLDDIISNTAWGSHGLWENYRLQLVFSNNEPPNYDRFFLILERITKDPAVYIDLMELMYFCLSLGFKGNYRTTESGNTQLEQIADSLYKLIRSHHGNFSKTLSPFLIKPSLAETFSKNTALTPWGILGVTVIVVLALFVSLGYMLDSTSNQAYQELTHIGNSILYETPQSV